MWKCTVRYIFETFEEAAVFQSENVSVMEVGQRLHYGTRTGSDEVSVPDLNMQFKDGSLKLVISPQ